MCYHKTMPSSLTTNIVLFSHMSGFVTKPETSQSGSNSHLMSRSHVDGHDGVLLRRNDL